MFLVCGCRICHLTVACTDCTTGFRRRILLIFLSFLSWYPLFGGSGRESNRTKTHVFWRAPQKKTRHKVDVHQMVPSTNHELSRVICAFVSWGKLPRLPRLGRSTWGREYYIPWPMATNVGILSQGAISHQLRRFDHRK